jgi:hypothetical protein
MPLPNFQEVRRRHPLRGTGPGRWVSALTLVFMTSLVGFLVLVITETGTLLQSPWAVALLLIAVASLLVASIVAISAAMKRRTRSRLPSPAEEAGTVVTPVICAMGAEHPDVFSARMCDIGSLDDACLHRLNRIADDHPDRMTRQEAAERLKTHRGWNETSPAASLSATSED